MLVKIQNCVAENMESYFEAVIESMTSWIACICTVDPQDEI